jgi:hypothetical protein
MMSKTERKNLTINIQKYLKTGIVKGDKDMIIQAYALVEDLLEDYGVFCLNADLSIPESPKFPHETKLEAS